MVGWEPQSTTESPLYAERSVGGEGGELNRRTAVIVQKDSQVNFNANPCFG